jgi:lipopolysaccharide export system protein LptC
MSHFVLERFEPTGRLKLRIGGAQMRHFPDTDRIEIEAAKIEAFAPDGRVTLAHAQRALSNGDGSEVQLIGAAQVDSLDRLGAPLHVSSEFLHIFTAQERLRTHLPVLVKRAGAELRAGALYYDHSLGRLELIGQQHAVFAPRVPAQAAIQP